MQTCENVKAYRLVKRAADSARITESQLIAFAAVSQNKTWSIPDHRVVESEYRRTNDIPEWLESFCLSIVTGKISPNLIGDLIANTGITNGKK